MPKDEFDFDDPMELNGMGFLTDEDTTNEMAECFIEEFMRLGHNHKQVLALFRNPHYIGMNMVLQNRGEDFVKAKIVEVFGWWGRKIEWPPQAAIPLTPEPALNSTLPFTEVTSTACDPMGEPIPKLNL